LQRFLTPSLTQVSPAALGLAGGAAPAQVDLVKEYNTIYRNLIIVQGVFAGLAVGKMAEGAIISGIKHSLFMTFAGGIIFTLAV